MEKTFRSNANLGREFFLASGTGRNNGRDGERVPLLKTVAANFKQVPADDIMSKIRNRRDKKNRSGKKRMQHPFARPAFSLR